MYGEMKTTLNLSDFMKFDSDTAATQLKLSASKLCLCGKTDGLPDRLSVYVNAKGNIIVFRGEERGYPVADVKGTKVIKGAGRVLSTLKKLGTVLPQTQDLERDEDTDGWTARLDTEELPPPRLSNDSTEAG